MLVSHRGYAGFLKLAAFRRDELTSVSVCKFLVEEPVHYLSALVFEEIVPQFDCQDASRLFHTAYVAMQARRIMVTVRRRKRT